MMYAVASLMKVAPTGAKADRWTGYAPTFAAKLQEPECAAPLQPAAPTQATPGDLEDDFNPFLSCGTCFVPVLDLSPDEHGVTVNTFGSTGEVAAAVVVPTTSVDASAAELQPVLLKPLPAADSEPVSYSFRQLVDCPTCFVPSSDLSYVCICVSGSRLYEAYTNPVHAKTFCAGRMNTAPW